MRNEESADIDSFSMHSSSEMFLFSATRNRRNDAISSSVPAIWLGIYKKAQDNPISYLCEH